MGNAIVYYNIMEAVKGIDIICTDSLPALFRGEEVSGEVMESPCFVGYGFKKHLLTVQQAVMLYCL